MISSRYTKPMRGLRVNPTHPLAQGLLGYWLLGEGTGSITQDLSGYRNHALLQLGYSWSRGLKGNSVYTDGVDGRVAIDDKPGISELGYGSFSISFWTRRDAASQPSYPTLFGKNAGGGSYIYVIYQPTRYIQCAIGDGVVSLWKNFSLYPTWDGEWHHIVFVADRQADLGHCYVDGRLDWAVFDLSTLAYDCRVAAWSYLGSVMYNPYNGWFSDFSIYDRVLSLEEISWLYHEPYSMFQTNGRLSAKRSTVFTDLR